MRYASTFPSPIGALTAVVDGDGALAELRFERQPAPEGVVWDDARCEHVRRELDEYFAGARRAFGWRRGRRTEWRQRVRAALLRIPYGDWVLCVACPVPEWCRALIGTPGVRYAGSR
jgi:O6-methylguanine-DNA--protein-cysteine methyltransferase